jgi:hypothetical protein
VNGDHHADLAYGDMGYDRSAADQGRLYVHLGAKHGVTPQPAWTALGYGSTCVLGSGLAAGDVDGDGRADLAAGGHGYTRSRDTLVVGMVAVYRGDGRRFEKTPEWSLVGDQASAKLGIGLSLGDADGDGAADIAVGQPHRLEGQDRRGRVTVYHGNGARRLPPAKASAQRQ